MRYQEIIEEGVETSLIYRWVDSSAVRSYLRMDGMKARHKHFLPKQLSGASRSKLVTGLSFAFHPNRWRAASEMICFVVDRTKLSERVVPINGQSIYNLTQSWQSMMVGATDARTTLQYIDVAIEESLSDADEAFVMGDIRPLSAVLTEIRYPLETPANLGSTIQTYCLHHGVDAVPLSKN